MQLASEMTRGWPSDFGGVTAIACAPTRIAKGLASKNAPQQELEEVTEAEAAVQPHVEPNFEELDLEDLDFAALNIEGNDVAEG